MTTMTEKDAKRRRIPESYAESVVQRVIRPEDAVQPGHLEEFTDPCRSVHKFQRAALTGQRDVSRNQFAKPRAVDVRDAGQVQHDQLHAATHALVHGLPETSGIVIDG